MDQKKQFANKKVALLLWCKDEKDQNEVVAFYGKFKIEKGELVVDRGKEKRDFKIYEEWIHRIKPNNETTKSVLGDVDYILSLSVKNLDDEEHYLDIIKTGLKWPSE